MDKFNEIINFSIENEIVKWLDQELKCHLKNCLQNGWGFELMNTDIATDGSDDLKRNWSRNKQLIDLSMIPDSIKETIINTYENQKIAPRAKILDYLIKKRCKMLVDSVQEF